MSKILFVLLFLLSTAATAETYQTGHVGYGKTFLCDTKEQVQELINAEKIGREVILATYLRLSNEKNQLGESVCIAGQFKFIVLEQVFSTITNGAGRYIVRIMIPEKNGNHREYFILSTWDVSDAPQKTSYCSARAPCLSA